MAMESARKLMGGVLAVVVDGARHAVWYLRYQVDGSTRDEEPPEEDNGPPDRRA
jgi:hypothetical protein